jgi:hypothetical protein
MTIESALRCPQCGEIDAVRKVSAIYNGGFSTVQNNSPLVPYGVVSRTITTITPLAQKLAPPPEPEKPGGMTAGCLLVLLLIGFVSSCSISSDQSLGSPILGLGITIALIFLVNKFIIEPPQKTYKEKLKPEWDEAIQKWSELYYCSRNDCVFDPITGKSVPPERISALIY